LTDVLKGVRVIELGTMITAPLAGMMLADLGADVIKVEHPQGGDPFRSFRGGQYSPHFVAYNRGKRSMQLDLRNGAGCEIFGKLLARSDILIENYRVGVMERLGLGAGMLAAMNPRLIHCSITGFGSSGPYCSRPAYDSVGLALSGIASLLLDPEHPQICGPTIPDNATGMFACYGILGALYERERTGRGRRVEINMLEAAIAFIPDPFANHTQMGIRNDPLTRVASSHSFALRCGDGKLLALHLSSQPKFWEGLLIAIGRPELGQDARFSTREARIKNYVDLTGILAAIFIANGWRCLKKRMCRLHRSTIFPTSSTIPRSSTSKPSAPCAIPRRARSQQSGVRCASTVAGMQPIVPLPSLASIPARSSRNSAMTRPGSRNCAKPR
jgi:crotonobetainyl-CoA:carnitine CoA-transferase CaiB-like acyl-CoA transferase